MTTDINPIDEERAEAVAQRAVELEAAYMREDMTGADGFLSEALAEALCSESVRSDVAEAYHRGDWSKVGAILCGAAHDYQERRVVEIAEKQIDAEAHRDREDAMRDIWGGGVARNSAFNADELRESKILMMRGPYFAGAHFDPVTAITGVPRG